jgi:tRNA U38,U39,U40 pseudouridine synthase TruA
MPKPQRGTFADLYNTEQLVKAKRAGRPRGQKKRKQFTLYLTEEQAEVLADLQHVWSKQFKVDRSDIAGLALEVLEAVVQQETGLLDFQNFESLKFQILKEQRP